ncbi:MAG: hypothetical protein Q8N77_05715 [Nanoarchaeota archaeon]|nr:hypothetical protein [Nanoarchaeota archaeon]
MKKRVLLFLLAFAVLLALGLVFKSFISASIFDTYNFVWETSINITVDTYPPDLIVDSPISTDYSEDNLVDINYSVSDSLSQVDAVWYNLNGGVNTTLTGNTTIRVAKGDYVLYMYANDTVNLLNGSESVSFSVSSESFKQVNFSHFDVSPSTNFSSMNDTELESITSLTLAKNGYGKVIFSQVINISESIDLDTYAGISDNSIYINSDVLPNFNKPATLWLYGLTFTNPRILKDGSVCPANICSKTSYSGGVLEFTVTGFTNYSTEETPTTPGPTGQAAGGEGTGGGGKKITFPGFEVTPDVVKVKLKQGETKSQTITIENTGDLPLEFVIDPTEVKEFTTLSDYAFELGPKQTKEVTAVFTASSTTEPDVYAGRIFIRTKELVKPVIVVIEVESMAPLFDVNMSIPQRYKKIAAGESVTGNIVIVNLGDIMPVDVNIDYVIKDLNGDVIDLQQETVAVEDRLSITKRMETLEDIKLGDYIFYVKVSYNGNVATASDLFSIVSAEEKRSWLSQQIPKIISFRVITLSVILIAVITVLVFMRKRFMTILEKIVKILKKGVKKKKRRKKIKKRYKKIKKKRR